MTVHHTKKAGQLLRRITFAKGILFLFLWMWFPCVAKAAQIYYNYDSLNRLTNVDYGNGSVISYTYDAAGNRLKYSGVVTNDADRKSVV